MTRKKVTISVQERDLAELKKYAIQSGRTISGSVKKALKLLYQSDGWSDANEFAKMGATS